MAVQREAVDHEGVGQQVEVLALVTDRVGTAKPQRIVERPVDGLGIISTPVERLEVRISLSDRPQVLGPVQLPAGIVVVAVKPNLYRPAA